MRVSVLRTAIVGGMALSLAACVSGPSHQEPTFDVMPGKGKTEQSFANDEAHCRYQAQAASGWSPTDSQNTVVNTAIVGTAIGALAGAAIGSTSAQAGAGAAIGGATGLLAGSAIGADAANDQGEKAQIAFDHKFAQCMTLRGNEVVDPVHPVYVDEGPDVVYVHRPHHYYWGPRNYYYDRW